MSTPPRAPPPDASSQRASPFAYQTRILDRSASRAESPLRPTSTLRRWHGLGAPSTSNLPDAPPRRSVLTLQPSGQAHLTPPARKADLFDPAGGGPAPAMATNRTHAPSHSAAPILLPSRRSNALPASPSSASSKSVSPLKLNASSPASDSRPATPSFWAQSTSPTRSPHKSHHPSLLLGGVGDLSRSSVGALKTLGSYTSAAPDSGRQADPKGELALPGITDGAAQDVTGLSGRVRLTRSPAVASGLTSPRPGHTKGAMSMPALPFSSSFKWMDKQRHLLKAYEYLCHCGEARDWMQAVLASGARSVGAEPEPLPPIVEMEERMRNGVVLAHLAREFAPQCVPRIFTHARLQYKHTDNINYFFSAIKVVGLPGFFHFELTDIYEKKNFPKVIYCIHALSHVLARQGKYNFRVGDLYGQLEFTEEELQQTHKGLEGVPMPKFGGLDRALAKEMNDPMPPPEPVETEADRIERLKQDLALAAPEYIINSVVQCQAIARGALVRPRVQQALKRARQAELIRLEQERRERQAELARLEADRIAREKERARIEADRLAREQERARAEAERVAREKERARLESERLAREEAARLEAERVAREEAEEAARLQAERDAWEEEQARQEARIIQAWVPPLQSQIRGILGRQAHAERAVQLKNSLPHTTSFQAVARGTLARRAVQTRLTDLDKLAEPTGPMVGIQSALRGRLARQRANAKRTALRQIENGWIHLQAHARGAIARSAVRDIFAEFDDPTTSAAAAVLDVQAAARGLLARREFNRKKSDLSAATAVFSTLQSTARGVLVRRNQAKTHEKLIYMEENRERRAETSVLQAACRGALVRRAEATKRDALAAQPVQYGVVGFQAAVRAALARQRLLECIRGLRAAEDSIIQLQACIRAAQCRARVRSMASALQRVAVQQSAVSLQSFARAALTRRRKVEQRKQLETVAPDVRGVQAQIRGVLVRAEYDWWRNHVYASEPVAIFLQSVIRGARARSAWRARQKFWNSHIKNIVTVQSIWRSKQQGALYRALVRGTSVPVEVIRAFAHLLSDSDADWADEIEVGRLRRLVVRSLRDLSTHEHDLAELDRKIALLVKNVIGIEELVRLKNERGLLGTGSSSTMSYSTTSRTVLVGDPFAEKQAGHALDRAGQAKLELYQTLFFLLQTRPGYLARLYVGLDQLSLSDRETKQVEKAILTLFGYGQDDREEFLLLKLIEECVRQEAAHAESPQDLLGGRKRFAKFIAQQYSDRSHGASSGDALRIRPELVGPPIVAVLNDSNLNLETNPKSIWTSLHPGQWPDDDVQQILHDPQTRTTYIHRLQALHATTESFVSAITSRPRRLPFGLRYIARTILRAAEGRFPEQNSDDLARSVGFMIYYRYFRPAIIAPEEHGVLADGVVLDTYQRSLLSRVDRIMADIAHGKMYGAIEEEDPRDGHLAPLNEFMVDATRRFTDWILAVTDVPDLEIHFAAVDALDATGQLSRAIDISPAEVYAFHGLLLREIEVVAPETDDILRSLLQKLGAAPAAPSPNEVTLVAARNQEVTLELIPHGLPDPEAEGRALWVETKRLVLNVLRVQTGSDLFTVLLEEVTEDDERAWLAVAEAERATEQRNALVSRMGDRPLPAQLRAQHHPSELPLEDLRQMSFVDVKAHTLQRVLDLERSGKVTRANGFQDLLDALAHDIRLKNTMRTHRKAQMMAMSDSLRDLAQRKTQIDERIQSYHSVIEQSIAETHKKGSKKRGLRLKDKFSWSSQAKHMRNLDRQGMLPAFGSFLFSALKLEQRGVLLFVNGSQQVDFTISSDRPGVFKLAAVMPASLSASPGRPSTAPLAEEDITLERLLELQWNGETSLVLLNGLASFNTDKLIELINRKFYASS